MEKLRPDELESFKEAFEMFDKNADGTISMTATRPLDCGIEGSYVI